MILSSPAWLLAATSLCAVAAYALPALARGASAGVVRGSLIVAWLLHALLLADGLLGASARFGFAPSISVTAWLVLTVYAVESRLFPNLRGYWGLCGMGAAAVLLAWLFPGTPLAKSASPWLALHWALGIASYGLFAAAVVHGYLMGRAERQMRQVNQALQANAAQGVGLPLMTLERLMFGLVVGGFVLLTGTLLAGWLFAESLYGAGAAWKWNHKTIFSTLSWLAFATLLWGRWQLGWRGKRAVRMLYAGAGLLLLGYAGSRFVLEVILQRGAV
jgi:ABC-type uncharacterized transport system permease subunit